MRLAVFQVFTAILLAAGIVGVSTAAAQNDRTNKDAARPPDNASLQQRMSKAARAGRLRIVDAQIRDGRLLVHGVTTKPGTTVTLDERYRIRSRNDRSFAFAVIYMPEDCIVQVKAGKRRARAVVGNCGPRGKTGARGRPGAKGSDGSRGQAGPRGRSGIVRVEQATSSEPLGPFAPADAPVSTGCPVRIQTRGGRVRLAGRFMVTVPAVAARSGYTATINRNGGNIAAGSLYSAGQGLMRAATDMVQDTAVLEFIDTPPAGTHVYDMVVVSSLIDFAIANDVVDCVLSATELSPGS